jgi:hypothetical protein
MSCRTSYNAPGTPTLSSGLTSQRANNAIRCDQARLLEKLRNNSSCNTTPPSTKSAIYSSILEQEHATACQPSPVVQALQFPKVGVPESVRIQRKVDYTITCASDQSNPETRYSYLRNFVTIPPCPPPTAAQLNSTTPRPTFWPGCLAQRNIR